MAVIRLRAGLAAVVALAAAVPALAAGPGRSELPRAWGTSVVTYVVIDGAELSPRNSSIGVACIQNCQLRYATSVVPEPFYAPVHLPAGALVTYIEIDFYDASTSGQAWATLAICDPAGSDCQAYPGPCSNLAEVCSGEPDAPGFFQSNLDISVDDIVVDNEAHRYFLAAGNSSVDGSTAISQVILGYVRQVSPPPPFPSFADVPTNHPFFQFVEALVASGITAGCGESHYCPDAPLTRGQMAVFLAKALGLQWN